jgi:hypothetical protein
MPGLLSRIFRRKGAKATKTINGLDLGTSNGTNVAAQGDPWDKTNVKREDVVDLLRACGDEIKARGIVLLCNT